MTPDQLCVIIITSDQLCVIITSPFHLCSEHPRVVLIFTRAVLSGTQSCFLSNQEYNLTHMVLFITEADTVL